MRLRWSPRALRDLDGIFDYIAKDNPAAALDLQKRAEEAALAPLTGRTVPELSQGDVREVFVRSYRIVYRVMQDEWHVLTVFEGASSVP